MDVYKINQHLPSVFTISCARSPKSKSRLTGSTSILYWVSSSRPSKVALVFLNPGTISFCLTPFLYIL